MKTEMHQTPHLLRRNINRIKLIGSLVPSFFLFIYTFSVCVNVLSRVSITENYIRKCVHAARECQATE